MTNIELLDQKNKLVTAFLALFLGTFGAHRFYLGQTGRGILYLLFFWTFIPAMVSFIDFLVFLAMEQDQFDRKFNPQFYQRRPDALRQGAPAWHTRLPPPPVQNQRPASSSEHDQLLHEVAGIRNDIYAEIQANPDFRSGIVSEIKPLVDTYIGQVRELIERDRKMKEASANQSLKQIEDKIGELQQKMLATTSPELKTEYARALERHSQHQRSLQEFFDQREMNRLRLDATIMSLREVKLDLLRLQHLSKEEQREEFGRMFDEKTSDLSEYLRSLKQSYTDNRI